MDLTMNAIKVRPNADCWLSFTMMKFNAGRKRFMPKKNWRWGLGQELKKTAHISFRIPESHWGPVAAESSHCSALINCAVSAQRADSVSDVNEFCEALGGKRPIHSILVANNGMAAVKFMRSIRTWAYETFGNEKAILLVAMATAEDMKINAEYIRIADSFVEVPGGTNNNNFANVQLIVEIAETTGVSAVWPGWGHASENPELPDALNEKGVIFLGPTAVSMAALGDKIGSSLIAQAAGVPTLPWSGSHIKIPAESCLEAIPEDIYRQACVHTSEEALQSCQTVGYPAMIKASWGGGGKGIRKVHDDDEVKALFNQVQAEVPGSPIFIMKVASQSRHLEVQLLCDQHGNVAALHSRDCSVQRRHQKIIEEGPITIVPKETVKELEEAARRLAKCVNYVGAATVEYLYDMETGQYYFLELNPRLQVEHPVTEAIAEVNLPAAQVAVGMGIPLWKIPEIRRFYGKNNGDGYDGWKRTITPAGPFDFDKAASITPKRHCIAVRITSEDPDDGFKPTSGKVQEIHFKSKPNVWAYFSVKSEGGIHEFSDSQFGHVFAFGDSRDSAIANMVLGLKEIQIRGEIRTNVDYIIDLLNALDYRENKIHTGWLDSRIAMKVKAERPPSYLAVVAGALYKASTTGAAIVKNYTRYLRNGQIPPKNIPLVHSQVQLNIEDSKYKIDVARGGVGRYKVKMNDSEIEAEIHTLSDRGLLMQLDGNSHVIYAEEEAAGTRLLIDGRTCLLQNDYDPSKLVADSPCKLLRFLVSDGSHADEDTPYAEVEVMKMCRPLVLPASGYIHFVSAEGQQLQAGHIFARVDLDDPSATKKSEQFHGPFPALGPPTAVSCKINQRCAASVKDAQMLLAGYDHNIDGVVRDMVNCLDNPQLPFLQWQASMSVLATRLPLDLRNELEVKCKEHGFVENQSVEFPAKILRDVLEEHLVSCSEKERSTQKRLVEPLLSLVKSHEGGRESYTQIIARSLFEDYLSVEELFDNKIQADVIEDLRLKYENDLLKVVEMVLSHQGVRSKNKLILRLMEALVYKNPAPYRDQLLRFSALNHTVYSKLALKSYKLLEQTKRSELGASIAKSISELSTEEGETTCSSSDLERRMENLVGAPLAVEDVFVSLFDLGDPVLQRRIVETYIRRLYEPYLVKGSVKIQWHGSSLLASWVFSKKIDERNAPTDQLTDPVSGKNFQRGFMVVSKSLEHLPNAIDVSLKEAVYNSTSKEHTSYGNILHIALIGMNRQQSLRHDSSDEDQVQETVNLLEKILKDKDVGDSLQSASVRKVSFIIEKEEGESPIRHTYHISADKLFYQEEPLLRHLEPPLSTFLELGKLRSFENIKYSSSQDRQWHLYSVVDKDLLQRTFLRTLVRQPNTSEGLSMVYPGVEADGNNSHPDLPSTSLSILRSATSGLKELELHVHNASRKSEHNHMYLCILREQQIDDLMQNARITDTNHGEEFVGTVLSEVAHQIHELVGFRMHQLAVCEWEVKLVLTSVGSASGAWRIVIDNFTDQICAIQVYREVNDINKREIVYYSPFTTKGPLHGKPVSSNYEPFNKVDKKRWLARKSNTTYCYDFPLAFETALKKIWEAHSPKCSKIEDKDLLKVNELIFSDKEGRWGTPLVAVDRPSASNDVGMVAWSMEMRTPEFPGGRSIFVVANDVTFKAGSFGQREDAFFHGVAKLACETKLPLIYLAANSGARIGVAEEVKSCFRIGWSDELNPEQGFQYLYMTPEDHDRIGSSVISHELKLQNGEVRWVIDTIVGEEDGLGVENLTGSGAIASAFSRAYKETFTLTYVTGRTVGIGAYLARLGMRCIQRQDQPIILTGFSALNKLLGREVYSSNMQLGGPKIMATNGVVHLTVSDDLEGVTSILNWLSYVPSQVGGQLPILPSFDSPERLVEYIPQNSCDPRAAISGVIDNGGKWCGGIFDKDSFVETLDGWAKTVVTGRAKLGGIPVGVIAVETQTVMQVIPADPGQSDSHERIVPQPGQVWFPDSASKTSQALSDFNLEELPLFILANWRGFSGGQRDLFEGILQAGSMIVENLRNYKQPVFVYIPMMGELRGGAWVVVDSRINPDHIEMYAENTAKGNVLEPQGMIEIKFRRKEILECMGRLDKHLIDLKTNLEAAQDSGDSTTVEILLQNILAREKQLLPIYTQIATSFAELHDTSYRMAAKGVIKEVVNWSSSRFFFYKRLRRRIEEGWMVKAVQHAAGEWFSYQEAENLVQFWFFQSGNNNWEDDESFYSWKNNPKNYEERLKDLRMLEAERQVMKLAESPLGLQALPGGLASLLSEVEPSIREKLLEEIKQELGFANESEESHNNSYTCEILM